MKKFLLALVFCICWCSGMESDRSDHGEDKQLLAGEQRRSCEEGQRFRRITVIGSEGRETYWEIVGGAKHKQPSPFKIWSGRKKEQ